MADKKISELTALTTPDGAEELVVNDGGTSKKITTTNLIKSSAITNNAISGDKIDGGTISNFTSTGIDDNATSTAVTLASSGNVGIGTSSPTTGYKLDVSGNILLSAASPEIRFNNGGAYLSNAGTANTLTVNTSGIERMRIDNNGNVGIGTSSPSGLHKTLNIDGGSSGASLALDGGSNFAVMFTGTTASDPTSLYSNTGFKFATATAKDATGFSEKMRITSSGNVGIGTTGPTKTLSIHETSSSAGTYIPVVLSGGRYQADYGVGIGFRPENNSGAYGVKAAILGSGGGYGYNQADIHVCISTSTTAGDEVTLSDKTVSFMKNGGITFNGDTAAANALDDYEEGTWTPTSSTVTLTSNTGVYTRVGRLIICSYRLFFPASASGSAVIVEGLPFTNGEGYPTGYNGYNTCGVPLNHRITGTSFFVSNAESGATVNYSFMAGREIQGTFIYHAA